MAKKTNESLYQEIDALNDRIRQMSSQMQDQEEQFDLRLRLARANFEKGLALKEQETAAAKGRGDGALEMVTIIIQAIKGGNNGPSLEDLLAAAMAEAGDEGGPGIRMMQI